MTATLTAPTDLPDVETAETADLAPVCELAWGNVTPGLFEQVITTEECTAPAVVRIICSCGKPKQHIVTRLVCAEHRDAVAAEGMLCVIDACGRESRVVLAEPLS